MSSFERESQIIVIAGASSLLGAELKSLLGESKFADWDFRLLDEEETAGTLTEAGGEPALIQPVEEGSFDRARLAFFTGSPQFTRANLVAAHGAKSTIVDLSGHTTDHPMKLPMMAEWFPGLEMLRGVQTPKDTTIYAVPSAAATAVSALALALAPVGLKQLVVTCFQSVSEAGRAGIEELESQTSQLLSFQSLGEPVFDAQVAFSLLDRYGSEASHSLAEARRRIRAEVKACIAARVPRPAVQVVHAPVFYGAMFSAWVEVDRGASCGSILEACKNAGFFITEGDQGPSNVSVAGENIIQLAVPEPDPAQVGTWWFWGAADNVRLPAWNAVKLAEELLL
jgi:aspartate-semialdehyde dehydrogenase